jgi:hypothetical protein
LEAGVPEEAYENAFALQICADDVFLKATGRHLCLLLNFGKSRLEIARVAHDL